MATLLAPASLPLDDSNIPRKAMRNIMAAIESKNPSSPQVPQAPMGFGHAAHEWTHSGLSWRKVRIRGFADCDGVRDRTGFGGDAQQPFITLQSVVRKDMVADLRLNGLELLAQMFEQLLQAGFHSGALCGFKPVAIAVTCEKRSSLCRTRA
jgi:hypothetical protein